MSIRRGFSLALLPVLSIAAGSCSDASSDGDVGPIETGLRSIPLTAYDIARDEGNGSIEVSIGDVAAAADAARLDDPAPGRDLEDDVVGWTFELSRGVEDDETELTLVLPYQFQGPGFAAVVEEQLGLDLGAMERYASVRAAPFELLVFGGDLELSSSLDEVGDGVLTFGDGEDYEIDFELARLVDSIGRPMRLAESDGDVALSLSTPTIEAWITDGDTLAEEDDYLALAQALDRAGALGAYFYESDFDVENAGVLPPAATERVRDDLPITESFDLVGLGMTINDDGEPANAIAYAFSSESRAEDAMSGIEEAWTTAKLLAVAGKQIDDLVDFDSIERVGNVVTVTVTPADDRDTAAILNFLFRSETPFLYS